MNWISSVVRPKISSIWSKRDTPKNLWIKCPETGEMVFHRDLQHNGWVVPGSGFHMRMPVPNRLETLFDEGAYETLATPQVAQDPLRFKDERRYVDRLKDARAKTGRDDAVTLATGTIETLPVVVAVQDFGFMGGSLGMAAGEAIITGADTARQDGKPFVLFAASGGARMQEGILSLMQLPRTTAAIIALREAGLPYIVVLTNPTTGGVTASYAMLGDIHLAEPGALIGFAGPRVIEQTIREKLPEGFQRSEYLFDHGMVDMVVHRHQMRATLAQLLRVLTHQAPVATASDGAAGGSSPAAAGNNSSTQAENDDLNPVPPAESAPAAS
ncbi:MAG: acetyl-CoA carboxylase, carboxyltransferase subunit beta [Pseudomonadota bacterium]